MGNDCGSGKGGSSGDETNTHKQNLIPLLKGDWVLWGGLGDSPGSQGGGKEGAIDGRDAPSSHSLSLCANYAPETEGRPIWNRE